MRAATSTGRRRRWAPVGRLLLVFSVGLASTSTRADAPQPTLGTVVGTATFKGAPPPAASPSVPFSLRKTCTAAAAQPSVRVGAGGGLRDVIVFVADASAGEASP